MLYRQWAILIHVMMWLKPTLHGKIYLLLSIYESVLYVLYHVAVMLVYTNMNFITHTLSSVYAWIFPQSSDVYIMVGGQDSFVCLKNHIFHTKLWHTTIHMKMRGYLSVALHHKAIICFICLCLYRHSGKIGSKTWRTFYWTKLSKPCKDFHWLV